MITIETFSAKETEDTGEKIGRLLREGDVICLSGNLGAGKTAFVSGIAKGLDIKDHITSPTFTIVNEYSGRLPLYHFDVYRITDIEEMYDIGYEDYINGNGVSVIEWAELISEILPEEHLRVTIARPAAESQDNHRIISIGSKGSRYADIQNTLKEL